MTTSMWHYLMAVTGLAANSDVLEITVATETTNVVFRFDLGQVLPKAGITTAKNEDEPMAMARARASLIKSHSLNEELQSAAGGADSAYLRALLERGADPKYVSNNGWTALMTAAGYGTADMVDILIRAGSDVNAADKNCGGQSVLTWASGSGREGKHKVHALLTAGANPKHTSENGFNALMSAASAGDLEAVGLLLAASLNVSAHDKDGDTALMSAARSGKANLIPVLIKAGADVNAKNNDGRTALMQAAGSYDFRDVIIALLKAGADPNLRDKQGRNALQTAEKNHCLASIKALKTATK